MEAQFKRHYKEKGPTGVGIMGSGQYTIPEGYAAVKLMKGGWRSNNIDPNARHCMASAVAGFIQTFGIDEPAGSYDDIELTDTVVNVGDRTVHVYQLRDISERRRHEQKMRKVNQVLSELRDQALEVLAGS